MSGNTVDSFSGNNSPQHPIQSNKYINQQSKNENGHISNETEKSHNKNNGSNNSFNGHDKAVINKNSLINRLNRNYENEDTVTNSSNEYANFNGSISVNKKNMANININDEYVELKILLPDKSLIKLTDIKQNVTVDQVYKNLIEKIKLDTSLSIYYYLFEIIDQTFERKLRPHEQPVLINLQNCSNKSSTCICLRKWYFNLKVESILAKNPLTLKYLFHQAIEDVDRNQVNLAENYDIDVNFFRENNRYLDYIKHVYKLDGYGDTVFPHCPCDSRKHGHVIVILTYACFKLKACSREGEPESQVVEFLYEDIDRVEVDDDEMSFIIEVKVPNKSNKKIKIYTGFYLYLHDCLQKAKEDHRSLQV